MVISKIVIEVSSFPRIVISTEAARALCEQRSGEIRFATTTFPHPSRTCPCLFSSTNRQSSGAPSIAPFAMGGNQDHPPAKEPLPLPLPFALCVARPRPYTEKPTISTEAAHSLIVSSVAEKSASPPKPFPSRTTRAVFPTSQKPQCRLKYWIARSCSSAFSRVANVPRFFRRPVFGSWCRE
jgi:hypothetical protein